MLQEINRNTKELPYEKFLDLGARSLTDSELLAILLRTGTKDLDVLSLAKEVLNMGDINEGILNLYNITYSELLKIKGIGKVKAIQILAMLEFSKRLWRSSKSNKFIFDTPMSVSDYYMQDMRNLKREEVHLAILDTRQRLMLDLLISRGTVNSSIFSVRDVLIESLKHGAVNIIIVHNHPSGNPKPSKEDISITNELRKACYLIGIRLNDHIIIGDNRYYSFREQGEL